MDIFEDICKDSYKISKLYVDFHLQDIFLEISHKDIFSRGPKNYQIDNREKVVPIKLPNS